MMSEAEERVARRADRVSAALDALPPIGAVSPAMARILIQASQELLDALDLAGLRG